jgi:hypothetical protein
MVTVAWLVCGCAAQPRPLPPKPIAPLDEQAISKGWWAVRFYMNWPEKTEPAWHLGALLGHQVVAPILVQYGDAIELWRFHRRAARDESGHRFTFYFYTTPQIAAQVINSARFHRRVIQLTAAGDLLRTAYSDPAVNEHPHVEDISDANWSPVLQKAWPYFIMGVSRTWLDLIDRLVAARPIDIQRASLEALYELYREVDADVVGIWKNEGRHAFLHHLNAIFEYEPLWIYERRPLKF